MLAEVITGLSCIYNVGCTQTSDQYFRYNTRFAEEFENSKKKIEGLLPTTMVKYVTPIVLYYRAGAYKANLSNNTVLELSKNNVALVFKWEY